MMGYWGKYPWMWFYFWIEGLIPLIALGAEGGP
jgi:hypothetical protein